MSQACGFHWLAKGRKLGEQICDHGTRESCLCDLSLRVRWCIDLRTFGSVGSKLATAPQSCRVRETGNCYSIRSHSYRPPNQPPMIILCARSVTRFSSLLVAIGLTLRQCEASAPTSCSYVVSSGDAALGIRVVSDPNCVSGGIGCIDSICRFCKTLENQASSQFISCASFTSSYTCAVSQGDYDFGVNAITDSACANGGLGCYNAQCRYCRFRDTPQSSYLLPCSTASGSLGTNTVATPAHGTLAPSVTSSPAPVTSAPAPVTSVPTPVTSAPAPATSAPSPTSAAPAPVTSAPATSAQAITLECDEIVSSGDAASGIDIVTDISCFEGGTGCFNNVCRYCKRQISTRSAVFVDCTSVDSTAGDDIDFTPLPVFPDTPTPAPTVAVSVSTTTTAPCTVSTGDAAAGIAAYTDASCATGGLGCYSQSCRFCQQRLTPQAAPFVVCPSTVQLMLQAAAQAQTNSAGADFAAKQSSQWTFSLGVAGIGVAAAVAVLAFAVRFSGVRHQEQIRRSLVQPAAHEVADHGNEEDDSIDAQEQGV